MAKNHHFGKFWHLGDSCTDSPLPTRVKFGVLRPKVYTYTPNFIWMCSLYPLPVAKNHNFGQIWTFGLLYRLPLTGEGQISCARADPRYTRTCQISSPSVYSVALPIFAGSWTSTFTFSGVANWHSTTKPPLSSYILNSATWCTLLSAATKYSNCSIQPTLQNGHPVGRLLPFPFF